MAATNAGVLVELRASGQISASRGGAEPNLRVWPVDIEDEARVRMVVHDDSKAKKRARVITSA